MRDRIGSIGGEEELDKLRRLISAIAQLLSPDSPKHPPKACFECAEKYAEKRQQDDEQDSLGA